MSRYFKSFVLISLTLLAVSLLLVVVKGDYDESGSLSNQRNYVGSLTGPFESSGSSSRYALVESIVKNKSFFFSEKQAGLASPDLVMHEGKYFSIFAPGVSFATIPFYMLGNYIGYPQLVTYLATTIVALINAFLVFVIARKIGASKISSALSGFIFLFGTNALTYALTLTQHHWSILTILLSVIIVFNNPSVLRNLTLGLLFGLGVLIDIPNAIILLPLIVLAISQHLVINQKKSTLSINLSIFNLALGLIPILIIFGLYNHQVTGSYYKLGQFLGRSEYPPKVVTTESSEKIDPYQPTLPFYSRLQVNGLYILLYSNERGWLYYSPIVVIGLIGLFLSTNKKEIKLKAVTIITMVTMTLLLYASFGDPWGGWSFGPRYLLPATALLSAGIGLAIDKWYKNIIFGIVFLTLTSYGMYVATLGAFTTTQVPPKQEAEHLSVFIPYNYEYNKQLISQNKSGSLFYNIWVGKKIPLSMITNCYLIVLVAGITMGYAIKYRSGLKSN